MSKVIIEAHLSSGISYSAYRKIISDLHAAGKVTGNNQSESLLAYSKLNEHRMNKWDKTAQLSDKMKTALDQIKRPQTWVLLTEGWCGDAAQSVPYLNLMADYSDQITLKILLRDEHLEVMDAYLTLGGRSIPKLIALDSDTHEELFTWGPRPAVLQKMVWDYKENPTEPYEKFVEKLHLWYAKDKHAHIEVEFIDLFNSLS
ncbi:thioredoxin family protein [Penaeicola halotolerans]|uniref:thioredoxin family protein n=1 Tax=Penaeicola halotolerans TaxID=2793196 RepID=UPI001CF83152|nr:thioredoxin family protein [Penaeicola halotolerans]